MRGATPQKSQCPHPLPISIHAPHARSDDFRRSAECIECISIHAPHARSDLPSARVIEFFDKFQSTLLMRGATRNTFQQSSMPSPFQSTLLMRGATSPRSSRFQARYKFQSTLLMRGATRSKMPMQMAARISIHAPHARSDSRQKKRPARRRNFNPRSSCEERLEIVFGVPFR